MMNLAGHPVEIFLYRFVLRKNAISYVVNESIMEDMYPDIDAKIQPLVQACSDTLLRYRKYCTEDTIMDGNILTDGCFEVMLSRGLGIYFDEKEKQNLFNDAHKIAELLMDVMDKRTKEMERGEYPGPQDTVRTIGAVGGINAGFEELGKQQRFADELAYQGTINPKLKKVRLTPQDLPEGVKAKPSYDHRGRCYDFEHSELGGLGKIVLINIGPNQTKFEAELFIGSRSTLDERKALFKTVVDTISSRMQLIAEL